MKMMWCWHCKMEVPMLDEEEFKIIDELMCEDMSDTKEFRQKYNLSLENCSIYEQFQPVREKYKEMTGFDESNYLAILHHRVSIYGEPCKNCGKPLRTSQASFCAACGKVVE